MHLEIGALQKFPNVEDEPGHRSVPAFVVVVVHGLHDELFHPWTLDPMRVRNCPIVPSWPAAAITRRVPQVIESKTK